MPGSMVYRLPVADVTAPHMALLSRAMTAIEAISDNRGYNFIAGFHGAPAWYCWHHQHSRHTPVQARLFLPWHRAYLWWLEQALQDQVEGTAQPYWDWTAEARIPPSYSARKVAAAANPLMATQASSPARRRPSATARPGERVGPPVPGCRLRPRSPTS